MINHDISRLIMTNHHPIGRGYVRGRPSSSFTLMIFSIVNGGRRLENDDKHHNYLFRWLHAV